MTQQPNTPMAIRKITPADFDAVGAMLGRAFDDDPVMNHLAKQDARRSERIRHLMDIALHTLAYPYGEVYIGANCEGAALWNPPGKVPHGLLFNLQMLPHMARIAGLGGIQKAIGAFDFIDKKHPQAPEHYYLAVIGIEPSRQGTGAGTTLIRHVLERSDREGVAAYLESSKKQNVPLYERLGFRVTEETNLPGGGPPVWLMWRDPQ